MRTARRVEILVEFMERHGDLSISRGCGPAERIQKKSRWEALAELLNKDTSVNPKSVMKWRKVWSDIKNNTKRKAAKIRQGQTQHKQTSLEKRILQLLDSGRRSSKLVEQREESRNTDTPKDSEKVTGETSTDVVDAECTYSFLPPTEEPDTVLEEWGPDNPVEDTTAPEPGSSFARSPTPLSSRGSTFEPTKRPYTPLEEYLLMFEKCRREDDKRKRKFQEEIEREKIRQRDIELRHREVELRQCDTKLLIQAQWVQVAKTGLSVLEKYLNGK